MDAGRVETPVFVVDAERVQKLPKGKFRVFSLPITSIAQDKVGKIIVANIVALGVITALSGVVSDSAIESAVLARVPRGTEELNRRALRAGIEAARELLRQKTPRA